MTDYGLYLWTFLLIGNAIAIVALSSLGSGVSSSMDQQRRDQLPPKF